MQLTLYVCNKVDQNDLIQNFLDNFKAQSSEECQIEVIDVLESPNSAILDDAFATPMIVRHLPEPEKKILINLHNEDVVVRLLEQLYM